MEVTYENKITEFKIRSKTIKYFDQNPIKINKKNMLILINQDIFIYDFHNELFLNDKVELKQSIPLIYFDFHTSTNNIFFVCSENNVKLYEIDNIKLNVINIIESLYDNIFFGCFHPLEPNIFLSASRKGFINTYDITNSSLITIINLKQSLKYISEMKKVQNILDL